MRFIAQLIFTLLLASVLEIFLPWWSVAVAAALGGFLLKSKANFVAGFSAIAILWLIKALVIESSASAQLSAQVAKILMVNNKALLFLITALVGGLVGGFAALTGSLLRAEKKKRYY